MSDSATPWTVAYHAPLPVGFSRQEYWSGLPFPSPGDLPNPGIEPGSPTLQADALPSEPPGKPISRDTDHKTDTCSGCPSEMRPNLKIMLLECVRFVIASYKNASGFIILKSSILCLKRSSFKRFPPPTFKFINVWWLLIVI